MPQRPPERIPAGELTLRRETVDDAEMLATTVAANLDHLAPWMPWATPAAGTVESQRERLLTGAARWDCGEECGYLLLADDGALLGVFGLHRRIGPGAVEIGYWLAAAAVGHGYATTAAAALTAAALELPDVDRVEIHCDEANVRSAAVPRRLGYHLDRIEEAPRTAPATTGRQLVWIKGAG
jgi:RimJ/RimL family protein N-acetyltransferase